MQLQYIDENLEKIMANPDNIMYLRPYDIGNKIALFAVVKEDDGVYKKIQLTEAQSKMTFPFEPIYWMSQGAGYWLLKDFMVFENWVALNTANIDGFRHKSLDGSKVFNIGIFATFSDGSATFIKRVTPKEFDKKGGIQLYIDMLKKCKDYAPQHDSYYPIENYFDKSNQVIIPELLSQDTLHFERVDYQPLSFKDEDGNVTDNSIIPLSSIKETVKILTKMRKNNTKKK